MQKEIKIEIPEGYEIDEGKSSFTKIVFKKIEKKLPQSFEDLEVIEGGWYIDLEGDIREIKTQLRSYTNTCNGVYPTKELAEASVALAKLLHIRKAYIGDWEPDWKNSEHKHCIYLVKNEIDTDYFAHISKVLSFPNPKLRDEFLKAPKIRELLEIAKPLL